MFHFFNERCIFGKNHSPGYRDDLCKNERVMIARGTLRDDVMRRGEFTRWEEVGEAIRSDPIRIDPIEFERDVRTHSLILSSSMILVLRGTACMCVYACACERAVDSSADRDVQ